MNTTQKGFLKGTKETPNKSLAADEERTPVKLPPINLSNSSIKKSKIVEIVQDQEEEKEPLSPKKGATSTVKKSSNNNKDDSSTQ